MKVAFISAYPPVEKGEAKYSQLFVSALAERYPQAEILVLGQTHPQAPARERLAPNVEIFRCGPADANWRSHFVWWQLLKEIRRFKPDVVQLAYGPNTDYGGRIGEPLLLLFAALRLLQIPVVVTLHALWMPEDVGDKARDVSGNALWVALSQCYFRTFTRSFTLLASRVQQVVNRRNSPMARDYAQAYQLPGHKLGEEPHGCWPNPVSSEQQRSARHALGYGEEPIALAFGFIRSDKGFEYMIDAFAEVVRRHPGTTPRLIIAGRPQASSDADYLQALRTQVERLGVTTNVIFDIRFVPDDEVAHYVEAADVAVLPYVRNVGPSGPITYTLSRRKAAIATGIGHNRALKGAVALVRPKSVADLAQALDQLLFDASAREACLAEAEACAGENRWTTVVDNTVALYRQLSPRVCAREEVAISDGPVDL